MEDGAIVDLYLDRDEEAIHQTTLKYGRLLRAVSYKITQDHNVAEECENDTYMEAWNRIPPSEPRTYLPSFLAKITRAISINRCLHSKRQKRLAHVEELSTELEQCLASTNSVEKELDAQVLMEMTNRFLRTLPAEKRQIFVLRYFYCEDSETIARKYGYSVSKVNTTMFRIRQDLRAFLKQEDVL